MTSVLEHLILDNSGMQRNVENFIPNHLMYAIITLFNQLKL